MLLREPEATGSERNWYHIIDVSPNKPTDIANYIYKWDTKEVPWVNQSSICSEKPP